MPSLRLLVTLVLLAGCAGAPREMHWLNADLPGAVWPSAPEPTRYAYAGELIGEANFGTSDGAVSGGTRLLRFLVGLDDQHRRDTKNLLRPQSGTVTTDGRILVTDVARGAIFAFDPALARLDVWTLADSGDAFAAPAGITIGNNDEILVADPELGRVVRLNSKGQPLGRLDDASLERPTGLARDPTTGTVFVADTAACDIKAFADDGTLRARFGSRGTGEGQFNGPTHLAFAAGELYVADTLNARIQVLDAIGNVERVIGRRGLYVGNFTRPKGVAVDARGNVHVIESYFDHLLVFDRDGRFLLPIGGSGAAPGQFFLPAGAWTDSSGRLFVADMYNGRVAVFRYVGDDA